MIIMIHVIKCIAANMSLDYDQGIQSATVDLISRFVPSGGDSIYTGHCSRPPVGWSGPCIVAKWVA